MKIIELYNEMQKELESIREGIFYQEFESSNIGDKEVMGKFIQITVPNKRLNDIERERVLSVVEYYYSDIKRSVRSNGSHCYSGSNNARYYDLNIEIV